jgi:hypothetical protein
MFRFLAVWYISKFDDNQNSRRRKAPAEMERKMRLSMIVAMMCVVLVSRCVWASSSSSDTASESDFKGRITFRVDHVSPADNIPNRTEFRLEPYVRFRGWLGAGCDTIITPKTSYSYFRPYMTLTDGKLSGIAGYVADSKNSEYAFGGVWLSPKFGKVDIFLDLRNYLAISNKASSYQDNFIEVTCPINDSVRLGISGIYDHWWNNKSDYYLVGPIAYYSFSKQIKVFVRYSYERKILEDKTDSAQRIRFGTTFSF